MSADSSSKTDAASTTTAAAAVSSKTVVPKKKKNDDDNDKNARLCNQWVASGIANNRSIQFLLQTLIESGCNPPEKFIRCMKCEGTQPAAGGFGMILEESVPTTTAAASATATNSKEQCHRTMQDLREQIQREQAGSSQLSIKPEIYICQQYVTDETMTHKTVHHELIHAVDMCRTNMDPLHNCVHQACTEIRAENLSGECSFWKELPRMMTTSDGGGFKGHGQACVRRRAILSVRANPNCTDRAEDYVDAAMPRCFQDYYPYDRHPNQR